MLFRSRVAMQKRTLLKDAGAALEADQALPAATGIPPVEIGDIPDGVKIEPIAMRVPVECFYIRCGSFDNFRWLRSTVDDWGGSIRNLTAVRSVDYGIADRIERQLALKESILSKLLGAALISDVALVGTDTFFREGAAVGIIFQARNNMMLKAQLDNLRRQKSRSDDSASLRIVELAGRKVSFLSSPDNSVRSFYVVDGDYHLVTTSR